MTSPYTDISATISSSGDAHHRAPTRSLNRRRSPRRFFKRRWLKKLRPKRLLRTFAVLFVLAAFVYVSKTNHVLSRSGQGSGLQSVATSGLTAILMSVKEAMSSNASSSQDPDPGTSTRSAIPLSTNVLALVNGDDSTKQGSHSAKQVMNTQTIYVVPEGSSLWRTGILFIDDEVLLDKLIDNLAERGMKVRNVSAGVHFIVNDLGSEGVLVVTETDGNTYESRVYKDDVVTNLLSTSNS